MNASPALFLGNFSLLLFAVNYMNVIIKEGTKLIFRLFFLWSTQFCVATENIYKCKGNYIYIV